MPITTPNEKLMELGMHNALELNRAQKAAQYERLAQNKTGRHILGKLAINYTNQLGSHVRHGNGQLYCQFQRTCIPNTTKNIDRQGPRLHRTGDEKSTAHVDAAAYIQGQIAVAVYQAQYTVEGSIKTNAAEDSEETATALAMVSTKVGFIISNQQNAITSFTGLHIEYRCQ